MYRYFGTFSIQMLKCTNLKEEDEEEKKNIDLLRGRTYFYSGTCPLRTTDLIFTSTTKNV
jgi:hypothetical protein